MRKLIGFYTAITLTLTIASASSADDIYEELTFNDLWALVQDRNFSAVEGMFEDSHRRTTQDSKEVDHTRWLFGLFGTNSPDIARFASDWLEKYPDSAFAHTAQIWILYRTGWYIRGGGPGRKIYPQAHAEFNALHHKAREHALIAYEMEPALLPASDGLLRLANSTGTQAEALEVLHEVMLRDPNIGTLLRALDMSNPGWGGSWDLAKGMCEYYAPMAKNHEIPNPVRWCKLMTAGKFHANKLDWYRTEIAKGEYPALDDQRVQHMNLYKATPEEAQFVYDYLTDPDVIDYEVAYRFDNEVAARFGFDFQYENHIRRAQEDARKHIDRDPYNAYYLETLSKNIDGFSITEDNRLQISVLERTPGREKREYVRRLLQGSPYDPELWKRYARHKFSPSDANDILRDEPYLINAIVYANHSIDALDGYLFKRWQLLSQLERLEWEMEQPHWHEQTSEQLAKSTRLINSWLARRATLDLDNNLRCPMMRAYRLYNIRCDQKGENHCNMLPQIQEMLEIIKTDVNDRRVCTGVMAAQEEALYFSPITIDLFAPDN